MPKKVKNQIIINKEELIKIFNLIYKENLDIVRGNKCLCVRYNNRNIAIIKLNEYGSIIGLTLQNKYGYLNTTILNKIVGLIYKEEA